MHRTPATRPRVWILLIVSIGLVAAACTSGGATGSASPVPAATPSVTPAQQATAAGSPAPSVEPETASPAAVAATPPVASLAVDGGDPVVGELGSYTWDGGGSDSPWLPGTAITVGAGERLTGAIDPDIGVAAWSARRVPAGTADGAGAVGLGEGAAPIAFDAPAAGHWSIQLTVGYADELGSAVYYWDVTVR